MKRIELSLVLLLSLVSGIHGVRVGGEEDVPVDSPDIVRLSEVALLKLNERRLEEEDKLIDLVEIVKASVQVVSGTLTRLTLKITEEDDQKLCEVKIWEHPWFNRTEVTHIECTDFIEDRKRFTSTISEGDDNDLNTFYDFMKNYSKVYSDQEEFEKRFDIFRANLKIISELTETEQGTGEYGITKFADLTPEEFSEYLGLKLSENPEELPQAEIPNVELPENFDWRDRNAVTQVKDQKQCASSWAFSAVATVEGQWAIKKGELLYLSEQQLVDCDELNHGCSGGVIDWAYKSIMKLGGLETEEDYPYVGIEGMCQVNETYLKVKINGAVNVSSDEGEIAQWVLKNGPVAAVLNSFVMRFYKGGISQPLKTSCNPNKLDHGVTIVGFGTKATRFVTTKTPYWIIKNSWGEDWGEGGYFRLYRGDGSCGVNRIVSSSVVN